MNYKLVAICILAAILFSRVGVTPAAEDDIREHRTCIQCGMDRKAYGYSRMLIRYEDGAAVGVCSLHCAVAELDSNKGRRVKSLLVADRDTRSLTDAEKAFWVIGGRKRGVMTLKPKWAFGTKAAALVFIDACGGTIANWEEVLKAAREETAQ